MAGAGSRSGGRDGDDRRRRPRAGCRCADFHQQLRLGGCHSTEMAAWHGSQHALAMQEATRNRRPLRPNPALLRSDPALESPKSRKAVLKGVTPAAHLAHDAPRTGPQWSGPGSQGRTVALEPSARTCDAEYILKRAVGQASSHANFRATKIPAGNGPGACDLRILYLFLYRRSMATDHGRRAARPRRPLPLSNEAKP